MLMQCDVDGSEATAHPCGRVALATHPTIGDFVQTLPDGAAQDMIFEVLAVLLIGMRDSLETEDLLYVKRLGSAEEWHTTIAPALLGRLVQRPGVPAGAPVTTGSEEP